jgi:hypothetical protein
MPIHFYSNGMKRGLTLPNSIGGRPHLLEEPEQLVFHTMRLHWGSMTSCQFSREITGRTEGFQWACHVQDPSPPLQALGLFLQMDCSGSYERIERRSLAGRIPGIEGA